jgi:hypothetical protein
MKVQDKELTDDPKAEWDQVREREWLISQNKTAHVAWSWAEVAALHAWYFQLTKPDLIRSIGRLDQWLIKKGGHDKRCGCGQVNLEEYLNRPVTIADARARALNDLNVAENERKAFRTRER